MTRRLIPVLAPLAVFVVFAGEPSGARTPKPTVAVMNATSDYLIGGVTNGRWANADTLKAALPESALVRSLSLDGERSLGPKTLSASQPPDICSWNWQYGDLGGGDDPLRVVGATWPLLPRPVKRLDPSGGTYRSVVGAFLRKNGVPKPIVRITGLYQADLDGDGRDDVVMTASHFRTSGGDFQISTTVGDYDLVMVRSVRNAKAVERVLYFERFGASAGVNSDGSQHWVLAIGDLDGDGDMEVVTELSAWEAGRTDVYAAATTAASRWRSVANESCGV